MSAIPLDPSCRIPTTSLPKLHVQVEENGEVWVYYDGQKWRPYDYSTVSTPLAARSNNIKFRYTFVDEETPKEIKCNHTWKKYTGFTESYNYCEKCDIKRNV